MDERRANPVLFDDLYAKPTRVSFDEPHTSSDGGVFLLNAADRILGVTSAFVDHIEDDRQPGKIQHTVAAESVRSVSAASPRRWDRVGFNRPLPVGLHDRAPDEKHCERESWQDSDDFSHRRSLQHS